MCGLFGSPPFVDPQLGELRRSGRLWRGVLNLADDSVPLALSGTRTEPDSMAIEIARGIPTNLPSWQPTIEAALFEHYEPYAEDSVTLGDPAERFRDGQLLELSGSVLAP